MATQVQTFQDPQLGDLRLRCNVLGAVFDKKTANVFVGELIPRDNDLRRYTWSMVEGGRDEGETPEKAFGHEIPEEIGIAATPLAIAKGQLECRFEDGVEAQVKYSGKLYVVGAFLVDDGEKINLSSGRDKEGDTFSRALWLPLTKAEEVLLAHTTSALRQQFIRETISVLRPIEQALLSLVGPGDQQHISAQGIYNALPPEQVLNYEWPTLKGTSLEAKTPLNQVSWALAPR